MATGEVCKTIFRPTASYRTSGYRTSGIGNSWFSKDEALIFSVIPHSLKSGERIRQNKVKCFKKVEINQVEFLAAGEARKAVFCPIPALKDRTFDSSGFLAVGSLIPPPPPPQHTHTQSDVQTQQTTKKGTMPTPFVILS